MAVHRREIRLTYCSGRLCPSVRSFCRPLTLSDGAICPVVVIIHFFQRVGPEVVYVIFTQNVVRTVKRFSRDSNPLTEFCLSKPFVIGFSFDLDI